MQHISWREIPHGDNVYGRANGSTVCVGVRVSDFSDPMCASWPLVTMINGVTVGWPKSEANKLWGMLEYAGE